MTTEDSTAGFGETDEPVVQCDYCGTEDLAYELPSGKGPVSRCIPCLAIEQGSEQFSKPFEKFIDNTKHEDSVVFDDREHWDDHRRLQYEAAREWYVVLGRIRQDKPILKRDDEAFGVLSEARREFLTNIMGAAAFYSPSEIIEAGGDPTQETLDEIESDTNQQSDSEGDQTELGSEVSQSQFGSDFDQ